MAKRGNHFGFATARVNANVESRSIIADALALDTETYTDTSLPSDCVNADGTCCACCGCYCTAAQKFAAAFHAKQGKTLRQVLRG